MLEKLTKYYVNNLYDVGFYYKYLIKPMKIQQKGLCQVSKLAKVHEAGVVPTSL